LWECQSGLLLEPNLGERFQNLKRNLKYSPCGCQV
jgi:hypothetical protein